MADEKYIEQELNEIKQELSDLKFGKLPTDGSGIVEFLEAITELCKDGILYRDKIYRY